MTAINDWSNFCLDIIKESSDYTHGIRKIVPDIGFETTLDKTIRLTNVGFKPNGTKISMLKKYYMNEESLEEAKDAYKKISSKGKMGSVAFSTIGEKKKFTHHQHCIQSISVRYIPLDKAPQYTVFYRQAELIKIFTGDMVFIRDEIMPHFGKGPVYFFFANAVVNAMYCPLMFIHDYPSWYAYINHISDESFMKRFKKWCEMYFSDEPINYSSAEVIRNHIHRHLPKFKMRKILNEFG